VVVTGNAGDFQLMDEFVQYLAELRNSSVPFEKLHNLCLPFRSLAAEAMGHNSSIASCSDRLDSITTTTTTGLGGLDSSLLCNGDGDDDYDVLLGELLREQPLLDWLEWDLPLPCLEGGGVDTT
jgi:hypothetical protein